MAILVASRACQLEVHSLEKNFDNIIDQYVENLKLPILSSELKLLFKSYVAYHYLRAKTTIDSRVKLALLGVCNVLLPYLNSKHDWQSNLDRSLYRSVKLSWLNTDNMNALIKVLNLIIFGLFLRDGKHLLIQHKILNLSSGIDVTDAAHSSLINKSQMEFMNREAIWRIIADFSTTIVPFINLNSFREYIMRPFKTPISSVDLSSRMFQSDSKQVCAVCMNQPFNPFIIGCSHIFCYYCIQTRYQTNPTKVYSCPKCNFVTSDSSQVMRYKIHNRLIR